MGKLTPERGKGHTAIMDTRILYLEKEREREEIRSLGRVKREERAASSNRHKKRKSRRRGLNGYRN